MNFWVPEQQRDLRESIWASSYQPKSEAEEALAKRLRTLCTDRNIVPPPRLLFSPLLTDPTLQAIPERNCIVASYSFLDYFTRPEQQDALLLHDLAHIMRDNISISVNSEIDADKLAVAMHGQKKPLQDALKHGAAHLRSIGDHYAMKQIDTRLQALEKIRPQPSALADAYIKIHDLRQNWQERLAAATASQAQYRARP